MEIVLNNPFMDATDIDALNFMEEATDDDGSCVYMPVCEDNETEIMIQSVPLDSLSELTGVSLHWVVPTDLGIHINLAHTSMKKIKLFHTDV